MSDKDYRIDVKAVSDFINDESYPEAYRFVFAYTITLTNKGMLAATLLRRHWLITDANRNTQEVRGNGVVGEQPRILPGESFQYTSAAVLETPVGCMQGNYEMIADDGVEFDAAIPVFNLSTPNTLH